MQTSTLYPIPSGFLARPFLELWGSVARCWKTTAKVSRSSVQDFRTEDRFLHNHFLYDKLIRAICHTSTPVHLDLSGTVRSPCLSEASVVDNSSALESKRSCLSWLCLSDSCVTQAIHLNFSGFYFLLLYNWDSNILLTG